MKQATSKDIDQIRKKVFKRYPNKSISNFGLIYVEDRWIVGLMIDGIRYVGEATMPYDAYAALQIDLERYDKYVEALERLDREAKGEDDDTNIDPNRADSTVPSK